MQNLVIRKYGTVDLIQDDDKQTVQDGEVRIKTAYAGLSYTDVIIKKGWYTYQRKHMPLPYTPGFEASGHITEVGANPHDLLVGAKVVVLKRFGCLSSEITAKTDEIMRIPDSMDLEYAASLPVNFFTAWHALNNIVVIFPKSRVLVTSAAGGVGGMLVQLAKQHHTVSGVVGTTQKVDYVQRLGAHTVYTYQTIPANAQFDVIFTATGSDVSKYTKLLAPNGKMIVYGFHTLVPRSIREVIRALINYLRLPALRLFNMVYNNQTIAGFNIIKLDTESTEFKHTRNAFIDLLHKEPLIHKVQTYPVEKHVEAFDGLEKGGTCGKVLIGF